MMSDIRQAFLMIRLSKISDRNKFTVIWRNKEGHLKAYRYTTIPFGYAIGWANLELFSKMDLLLMPKVEYPIG